MKHIARETEKLLKDWREHGFNGVNFIELYKEKVNTLEDFLSDGHSEKDFLENEKNYSIFIAHPDLYEEFERDDSCKYRTVEVDWYAMFSDMKKEMKKRMGNDITINHNPTCHEFEIIREKKKGGRNNNSGLRAEKNQKG
jgi:hypothetical protein